MGSPLVPPGPPTTIPGSSIAPGDGSGVQEDAGAKAAPTSGAPQTPAVVGTTGEIKFKPPPPLPPHFMPGGSPPTASGDGCQQGGGASSGEVPKSGSGAPTLTPAVDETRQ